MKANVIEKINATNQKYLKGLLGKEIPQKLKDQLNNMNWSYLDLIGGGEHKRGEFAPLGAMELPEIEERKASFTCISPISNEMIQPSLVNVNVKSSTKTFSTDICPP